MNKINIIQFMPYFPPHKWWVETVWEEIWKYWVKNNFWEFINVVTSFEQEVFLKSDKYEKILFQWSIIWYIKDWYKVLVLPSLEIISNFPIYKFWSGDYKLIKKYLKEVINLKQNNFRIFTHTRFFFTSLVWWSFAIKNKIKRIHIEHGSDYVRLSSKLKNLIAKIYDKIIWKYIFKKSDKLLAISCASKVFINREFTNRGIDIFYRWLDIPNNIQISENIKNKFNWKKIIWYVWRLYKWKNVEWLVKAYYLLGPSIRDMLKMVIVGDWEDFERLKKLDKDSFIYFTWAKSFNEALSYQKQFDIHVHPSSPGWWLATTLLQAMFLWCIIVASPNEWAKEIIENNKNWILINDDSVEEIKKWIELAYENIARKGELYSINKEIINRDFNWDKNIIKLYNYI